MEMKLSEVKHILRYFEIVSNLICWNIYVFAKRTKRFERNKRLQLIGIVIDVILTPQLIMLYAKIMLSIAMAIQTIFKLNVKNEKSLRSLLLILQYLMVFNSTLTSTLHILYLRHFQHKQIKALLSEFHVAFEEYETLFGSDFHINWSLVVLAFGKFVVQCCVSFAGIHLINTFHWLLYYVVQPFMVQLITYLAISMTHAFYVNVVRVQRSVANAQTEAFLLLCKRLVTIRKNVEILTNNVIISQLFESFNMLIIILHAAFLLALYKRLGRPNIFNALHMLICLALPVMLISLSYDICMCHKQLGTALVRIDATDQRTLLDWHIYKTVDDSLTVSAHIFRALHLKRIALMVFVDYALVNSIFYNSIYITESDNHPF